MTRTAFFSWLFTAVIGIGGAPIRAEECVDFKWDVAQERALFAGNPAALTAGADAKSAPVMQLQHLYELKLLPQEQVTFAATPGKKSPRRLAFSPAVARTRGRSSSRWASSGTTAPPIRA